MPENRSTANNMKWIEDALKMWGLLKKVDVVCDMQMLLSTSNKAS